MRTVWPFFFLGILVSVADLHAMGEAGGQAGAPDSTDPLKAVVAAVADKKERRAMDYEKLAQETLRFGGQPDAVQKLASSKEETNDPQKPWREMVGDALAGVDEGERLDPKAADWPKLREDLKKMQPPPPPPSKGGKSDKDKKKDKGKKDDQSGKGKGEPKDGKEQGEKGEKGNKGESGEDKGDGEQDSKGPPTPGSGGGKKQQGGKEGESQEESPEGEGGDQPKTKGKDPNKVKDFSSSKEGEGKMKDQAKEEDLSPMQSKEAGFGSLGEEKAGKEGKKKEDKGLAAGEGKKDKKEKAPEGMRMVGGGSGQKGNDKLTDPSTLESMARLEQVRQSDNPALIQQRLQPKDQRPAPSSASKPY